MRSVVILSVVCLAIGSSPGLCAQSADSDLMDDLLDMSLEELMNVEVTSVSKTRTSVFETPAAVHVLTSEEIRRSGATNIPEALRSVPGVEVVRINSHTYSVSIRGFTEDYANKLLVMIDGRTIYTPLFGGVWWNIHDLVLEDVDRIEVVRGPGGTLWGANAVNGVINIVTKKASETQGALITAGGGLEDQAVGVARYGGKLGQNAHYRLYSKYSKHDDGPTLDGDEGADEWDIARVGTRIDWDATKTDRVSLQGEMFDARFGESYAKFSLTPPYSESVLETADVRGGHILGHWSRTLTENSDLALQVFYDASERIGVHYDYQDKRDTFDVDFQHRFQLSGAQECLWGLGYRRSTDRFKEDAAFTMDPVHRDLHLFSGFIQDRVTLIPEKLALTVGLKLEHNDYTGLECQPSARLAWTPNPRNTVWGAVTRAVRTPSRYERDGYTEWAVVPGTPPVKLVGTGSDEADSEDLLSFELGYRFKPSHRFLVDVTAFAHKYDNLRTADPTVPQYQPVPVPHLLVPVIFGSEASAEAYGAEVFATWNVTDVWKLSAAYSFLQLTAHKSRSSTDNDVEAAYEGLSPQNQFYLRSSFDLPGDKELDLSVKYTDGLSGVGVGSYLRFDARFAWHINEHIEWNVVGQNLLDGDHSEYVSRIYQNTAAERTFFTNLIVRF